MKDLLHFELAKCFNPRRAAVSFVLVVLFVLMILLGLWMQQRRHGDRRIEGRTFSEYMNAPMCVLAAEIPALFLFLPIMAAITGASMVASESQSGTLRTMMIRPVSRGSVVLAKFTVLGVYLSALAAFMLVLTLALGWVWFGKFGDLVVSKDLLGIGRGFIILPADAVPGRIAFSYALAVLSLWSLASIGLLFGVALEQTAGAAMAVLGLYFMSYIVDMIPFFTELHRYLPTRHWSWWSRVYTQEIEWGRLLQHGLWISAYTAACLGLSMGLFLKKDIHS
jgi:ABC-2 type transport system permease protein